MPSHFDAVGFAASDQETVDELLRQAFEGAGADAAVEYPDGSTRHYVDPSGASLAIHADRDGDFVCCQPGFVGQARFRWRPLTLVRDPDDCRFCDLAYAEMLADDGEMHYPFMLTIENIETARALIPYGEPGEVSFAALCEDGEVWADDEALEQGQDWDVDVPGFRGYAAKSLIPSGLFVGEGEAMSSHVLAHGIVASVEERRNELRGGPFTVVRMDSLGGVFDVCLAPDVLEREELLAPGAVLGGTFWLVGRPLTLRSEAGDVPLADQIGEDGRPERRRGLGRFFGRGRG